LEGDWELAGTELPDIYVGQVAFAPIRAKGNRSDLKVAGKDNAGRPLTVQLHAQAAKTHLPKLIWMKRRIESLLQDGRTKEAIALAQKANLVCRGAAFIAWDDAEQVAIAQDEVYQPSLKVPSSVACSTPSTQELSSPSAPAFGGVAFMPAMRESQPERRPSHFKSKVTEWWNAIQGARSDVEEESKRLTTQLNRAIESVFCPDDAKKLTSIVLDWAKHTDEKEVKDILRPLLHKCDRGGDARFLRKVLSNFFLALPDPWRTRASFFLSALTPQGL
jgi:hypothetical protein